MTALRNRILPLLSKYTGRAELVSQSTSDRHLRTLELSSIEATAVSLKDLFEIGLDKGKRIEHAKFLQRELAIRMAHRIVELVSLPPEAMNFDVLGDCILWYLKYIDLVLEQEAPTTPSLDLKFTKVLETVLQDHQSVVTQLAISVEPKTQDSQNKIDEIFSSFFMSRIGLRFLIQHHIESLNSREGTSGIIDSRCSVLRILKNIREKVRILCLTFLGRCPDIEIEAEEETFTYIPTHIEYMLVELLKNACFATCQFNGDKLPPVKVLVVYGKEDVSIKISDRGGGIASRNQKKVWSFKFTTSTKPPTPLQGYGCGLPLSRLYARYFGGDLEFFSMENYGTDCLLHLSRLGLNCENLPVSVLHSPSMSDSTY